MDEPGTTRHSLILRLRDPEDEAAWNEFVVVYEPLVYQLARRKGLQDADARDLCQEVFLTVSGAIERWDPDPARGSFRGWLSRVARNLLINFLTRQGRLLRGSGATSVQQLLEAQPSQDAAATALFEMEYKRRVFRWAADEVRGEFAPATWQAFWRTAVDGLVPKEAAKELNLSVGAVYIARSRVLARLRERVEQLGDDAVTIIHEVENGSPPEAM